MSEKASGDPSGSGQLSRRRLLLAGCLGAASITTVSGLVHPQRAMASVLQPQTPLPGARIPKYVTALPTFSGKRVDAASMTTAFVEFAQQVLPPSMYPDAYSDGTWVWGYQVADRPASWPGCTVEAWEGRPTTVRYVNNLPGVDAGSRVAPLLTVDQTLHWADPLNQMGSCEPYAARSRPSRTCTAARCPPASTAVRRRGSPRAASAAPDTPQAPRRRRMRPSTGIRTPNRRPRCGSTTTPSA